MPTVPVWVRQQPGLHLRDQNVNPPNNTRRSGRRTVFDFLPPIGSFDSVTVERQDGRGQRAGLDPNSPSASIPVHIYVTPGGGYPFLANDARPDVNSVMGVPGNHGFSGRSRCRPAPTPCAPTASAWIRPTTC